MIDENPRSRASIAGHPLHPSLTGFPITCFFGALLTDLVYARTADWMWADFSFWLIVAGLVMGALAALAGLTDFLFSAKIRSLRAAWLHGTGNGLALVISLVNAFVHDSDDYAAIVPLGIVLSGVVAFILVITGWLGGELVFRDRVAVSD